MNLHQRRPTAKGGGAIMPPAKTNKRLPEIAQAIKALEKKTIQNVVEIGKLLHEAADQCEHGEYMNWLKREFGWSHETSRRYRVVYDFSQNPQIVDFATLDISVSALYLVARLLGDAGRYKEPVPPDSQAVGYAIIEAARHGRVSNRMALDMMLEYDAKHREPEPPDEDDDLGGAQAPGQMLTSKHGPVAMRLKPLSIIENRVSNKMFDIRCLIRDARKEIEPVVDRLQRPRPSWDDWIPETSKHIVKAIDGLQKLLKLIQPDAADHRRGQI